MMQILQHIAMYHHQFDDFIEDDEMIRMVFEGKKKWMEVLKKKYMMTQK